MNTERNNLFIAGTWQPGRGEPLATVDPASGAARQHGAMADGAQVEAAIASARAAFPAWAAKPFAEREAQVRRFGALVGEHAEEMARIIATETGKPLWETRGEVRSMQAKIDISVAAYRERTGESSAPQGDGRRRVVHRPHGVMAVFGPYNFPGHLPNGHIVPALLAGNTVVFKPSEYTPETARRTVELWQAAGLAHGEINLVQGAAATGQALAGSAGIDGILFTGSARTGFALHRALAEQPQKILALEMGGNNPLVVDRVANLDAAVWVILQSAYLSAGQRCTCARRLLVPQGDFGDRLLARLCAAVAKLRVDTPFATPQPFMGPVITAAARARILASQQAMVDGGARALVSAKALAPDTGMMTPGLVDVTGVAVADEEIFGPLLQVVRYADFAAALTAANATRYGLSAGLLSHDPARYDVFHDTIRAGIVNWNRPLTGASSTAPFGGVGASGNHWPGAYYAADYCAYPVASLESSHPSLPDELPPGITLAD
jgi:succinylglutamic semialdehyde dehydrogenase